MVGTSRSLGYGACALSCLALAAFLGWHGGSGTPEVQSTYPAASASPRRSSFSSAPSAPAPVYAAPEPTETMKALQPMIDARPEVQAQRRAIEAKAASGVDAVMAAWKGKPLDPEVAVQTVMALRRIGTPEAEAALARMKRESPMACGVVALLDKGERR